MPDPAQPRHDEEEYWQSGKEFVRLLIAELNQVLKANRITIKKRREICTSSTFALCNFLDQQWFKPAGQTQYPLLCFSETFFDVDESADLAKINFPHKSVELHGMVHDEINWFFDEMEQDGTAVPTGDVGTETADVEPEETDSDTTIPSRCSPCQGTGHCFCIRKGAGDPTGCPRCKGTGECKHCDGSGEARHPSS